MSNIVTPKKNFFEGRKLWFFFAAVAALLTAVLIFIIVSQLTSTTKYYVLNADIPARTQITETNLIEQVVSTGGQPPTALGLEDVLSGEVYAKTALKQGDILTPSNTGPLTPITEGIPDGFVTATFVAPASSAAGGKAERGTYVDIVSVGENTDGQVGAGYVLQHALITDATIDLDNYVAASSEEPVTDENGNVVETSSAADDSAIRAGIPTTYTVALDPRDAAKLLLAVNSTTIYVVLSAEQESGVAIPERDISVTGAELREIIGDAGAGTDNMFGLDKEEAVEGETATNGAATNDVTSDVTPTAPTGTATE